MNERYLEREKVTRILKDYKNYLNRNHKGGFISDYSLEKYIKNNYNERIKKHINSIIRANI